MQLSRLHVLSKRETEDIHAATLRLLQDPGIRVSDADLRDTMRESGCGVREETESVSFPASVVDACLGGVPSRFTVRGCGADSEILVGDGSTRFASGHGACFMFEPGDGGRRPLTTDDVIQFVALSERLDAIDMVGCPGFPHEMDETTSFRVTAREMLAHTTKPLILAPFVEGDAQVALELTRAVQGNASGPSRWICQQSMRSPLCLPPEMAATMRRVIPEGVPMLFHSAPQTGMTGPVTLSGLLLLYNVEMVAAIVASQMIRPGAPCVYGGGWGTTDLRRMRRSLASPEAALLRLAGGQMAQRYKIPHHSLGPDADAHSPDQQAAWEKMLTAVMAAGAQADLVINAGMFGTGMNLSLAQLVIDSEIIEMVKRLRKGVDLNPDRMAEEVIREVSFCGDYMTNDHTLRFLRSGEYWEPRVSERDTYEKWQSDGALSAAQAALAYAKQTLGALRETEPRVRSQEKPIDR